MANDLTNHNGGALAPSSDSKMADMFQSLVALAKDPSVDAAKMTSLVDLQMKMMDYSKQEEFNRDKIAAIMKMPAINKRGMITNKNGGVQSRYSKFEDIHRVVMPILRAHNLVISFNVGSQGGMVTVQPILSHTNGAVEKGEAMALPIDTTGSKNGTQGAGSAASYGKRHSLKAMLNIIEDGEDTDGRPMTELEQEGSNAASCGMDAYKRWYDGLAREEKLIIFRGRHEQFRAEADVADKERE